MRICLIGLLVLGAGVLQAAPDPERLWLPPQMADLRPDLERAAQLALASERCAQVVRGQPSRSHDARANPVLLVICRDAETRRTYYLAFERTAPGELLLIEEQGRPGTPQQPTATAALPRVMPDEGQAAAQDTAMTPPPARSYRSQPQAAAGVEAAAPPPSPPSAPEPEQPVGSSFAADEEAAWALCLPALHARSHNMLDAVLYIEPRPAPQWDERAGSWRYRVPIDARNPRGTALFFVAFCEVGPRRALSVDIGPRRR